MLTDFNLLALDPDSLPRRQFIWGNFMSCIYKIGWLNKAGGTASFNSKTLGQESVVVVYRMADAEP